MFIVIEAQTHSNGDVNVFTNSYGDRTSADNKYYTILADAAVSTVFIHSATMITSEGYYIKSEHYEHSK